MAPGPIGPRFFVCVTSRTGSGCWWAPYPPSGAYIEVPADTSCVRQGITPVPEEDCERACYALGFKPTGPRARPNITGCFVLTEGQYKGNCNYNTNATATCTPPCELYGAVVRSLCIRK